MGYSYNSNQKVHCEDTGEDCLSSEYLNTKHWNKLRKQIYNEHQGKCDRCGAVLPSAHMHVHHKTYKNIGHEEKSDLCLLCEDCHAIVHGKTENENGEIKKDRNFFQKKPKKKKRGCGKHNCNTCLHIRMVGKNNKIRFRCDAKNISVTYSECRVCGKYDNVYNAGENPIKEQVKKAIALEFQDGKTVDQINKKYRIAKSTIDKLYDKYKKGASDRNKQR